MSSTFNASTFQLGGVNFNDPNNGLQIPLTQVKNYTPTIAPGAGLSGTSANQAKHLNMGVLKLCWGNVSLSWTQGLAKSNTITIPLPAGLFTQIHSCQMTVQFQFGAPDNMVVCGKGVGTTSIQCMLFTSTGANQVSGNVTQLSWLVIGS